MTNDDTKGRIPKRHLIQALAAGLNPKPSLKNAKVIYDGSEVTPAEKEALALRVNEEAEEFEDIAGDYETIVKLREQIKKLKQECIDYHNVLADAKAHITFQNDVILKLRHELERRDKVKR